MIITSNNITKIFGNKLEYIDDGQNNGQFNMNKDLELAKLVQNGDVPKFRVYAWQPWCLSLGYNQKDDKIDVAGLKYAGYDMVRRPTGGRAVFHANELTYSLMIKINDMEHARNIYKDIHLLFIEAFDSIGAFTDYSKSDANFRELYDRENASVACFASSARYEVMLDGKKIIGSAQRVMDGVLLQHGSILLSEGHELISDFILSNTQDEKERVRNYILNSSATLSEAADREIDFNEAKMAIYEELNR